MRTLILLTSLLFALPSFANWTLVNEKSQFNFVTTKANSVTEINQFTRLQGTISPQGKVTLAIDLMSGETNVPTRNDRLKQFLFQTDLFPKAIFTSNIDVKTINSLKAGESTRIILTGEIGLHGFKEPVKTEVQVTKLNTGGVQVSSLKPIVIQAKDFDLVKGIEKLQALANLPSISNAVPITFSLYFTK